jgi:hypothetical protein
MIIIENINKLGDRIKYPTTIIVHQSHYEFNIEIDGSNIGITLARFSPSVQNGNPHPNRGSYLLMSANCNESIWFTKNELRDIDNVMLGIQQIIYKLC